MEEKVIQIGNFSYYPQKMMGQGATGCVYKGIFTCNKGFRNSDMQPIAVKTIKLSDIDSPVKKHLLDCEVAGLSAVKGNYVCQTYEILKDTEFYFVPMELCPNGTLRDYIKSKVYLNESESLRIFEKVLEGYCAINKAGFVHRDLKTENILLRSNMEPAIIDMGYCEKIETQGQRLTYNVGSPAYMSPEAYNDNFYSERSDVWALGVILHEMLTGTIPIMRTSDIDEYFKNLKNMKMAEIIKSSQNELINCILEGCLAVDTRERLGVKELQEIVYNHKFKEVPMRPKSFSTCEPIKIHDERNSLKVVQKPRPQQRASLNLMSIQQDQIRNEINTLVTQHIGEKNIPQNKIEFKQNPSNQNVIKHSFQNLLTPQNKTSANQSIFQSPQYQHRGSLNLNMTSTPMTKKKSSPIPENCKPQYTPETTFNFTPKGVFEIWPEHKFTNKSVATTEESQNILEKSLNLGSMRRKSCIESIDFLNGLQSPLSQSVEFNREDMGVLLRKNQSTHQANLTLNHLR